MAMAFSGLVLVFSCVGLNALYFAASHNTGFGIRSFDGTSDNFGRWDAVTNYLPLGITASIALGVGVALVARKYLLGSVLSLAQIIWLLEFAPGAWIS
jgi:hypothetical protein